MCFAAFRSVCKSWRSFSLKHYSYLVPPPPPWRMLPAKSIDSSHPTVYNLYAFDNDNQFYRPLIKNDEDVVFGVVYNANNLAYMKLGDKEWTIIEIDCFPSPSTKIESIHDLVLRNGRFYFVNQCGTVFVCKESAHAPHDQDHHYCCSIQAIKLIDPVNITSREKSTPEACAYRNYLVEV
ncbi:hypothetical protein Scep_023707 [Stephania cephalantha]|uniref:KIB1-4 beta-propeller domain-containing protein n=1 Tax=Stephania cephalantha TaxID=152367 RepID=A0AAP0F0L8_9MAGN